MNLRSRIKKQESGDKARGDMIKTNKNHENNPNAGLAYRPKNTKATNLIATFYLDTLPPELKIKILRLLDINDQICLDLTCKPFYATLTTKVLSTTLLNIGYMPLKSGRLVKRALYQRLAGWMGPDYRGQDVLDAGYLMEYKFHKWTKLEKIIWYELFKDDAEEEVVLEE